MKGQCEIQLIDNATGEVVQRTKDDNMITNAITNLLNPPPLFFAEGGDYAAYMRSVAGSMENLLGGVMLWSEAIPEDPDMILPPNIGAQVGYAGNDAYTGENAFRGSYNVIESGRTHTGFRAVWDFPSSAANGTIKCVTATSGLGGRCGWGGDTTQLLHANVGTATFCPNTSPTVTDYVPAGIFCGCSAPDTYVYLKLINSKTIEMREVRFPTYSMKIGDPSIFSKSVVRNYNDCTTTRITAENDIVYYNRMEFLRHAKVIGDCLHIYNAEQKNIRITKISLTTKELISQVNIETPVRTNDAPHTGGAVEYEGYLYAILSDFGPSRNLYKISITDPSEFTTITLPRAHMGMGDAVNVVNGQVLLSMDTMMGSEYDWFILDDAIIPCRFSFYANSAQSQIIQPSHIKAPFYLNAGYGSRYSEYWSQMLVSMFLPYLATINNLATPIQKTASQSMKVVYTFTDVES